MMLQKYRTKRVYCSFKRVVLREASLFANALNHFIRRKEPENYRGILGIEGNILISIAFNVHLFFMRSLISKLFILCKDSHWLKPL